jgi:hypothetical protein
VRWQNAVVHRRDFLRRAAFTSLGVALSPYVLAACSSDDGDAQSTTPPPSDELSTSTSSVPAVGSGPFRAGLPYGPLLAPDALGLRLPDRFTARVVARTDEPVAGTEYRWHFSPDGGACFADSGTNGEYVYVSNSETVGAMGGGASAIRFARDGRIVDAYRILGDTQVNCAGGPTPWGTWLSGEEFGDGRIWECDPFRASQGAARPALGLFTHEAAAVDPVAGHVYLTEDRPDGRLYRFTPAAYPDLARGRLEVARLAGEGQHNVPVEWITVSEGSVGAKEPRPAGSTTFNGGEGIWWHAGALLFTTKGDNRVWKLDTARQVIGVLYDDDAVGGASLKGVDNVTVSAAGEVMVAEDGDDLELVVLTPDGVVGPLLQLTAQEGTELAGPAFSPAGDRLYFSSQRARGGGPVDGLGVTYEVTGPFRG